MDFPHGQTITIVHAGSTDVYGDPTAGTSVDVAGCAIAPRSSSDITDRARSGIIVGLTAYFPPDTVILSSDSFVIAGTVWQLDGESGDWTSPFTGWKPGVEAALKRGAG